MYSFEVVDAQDDWDLEPLAPGDTRTMEERGWTQMGFTTLEDIGLT